MQVPPFSQPAAAGIVPRLEVISERAAEVNRLFVPIGLLIAGVGGAVLRLWQVNALGFNSDEAVYAGQAAAIAGQSALAPFFPLFRAHPLIFQFILALGLEFVSVEHLDLLARLLEVGLGLITVVLAYRIGSLMYGRVVGVIAAVFMAFMPYHVVVTRQALLDGPMTLLSTLTLYCMARFGAGKRPSWLYAASVAMGLTILTKETAVLLIGGIYIFLALCPEVGVRVRDLVVSIGIMLGLSALYPLTPMLAGGGSGQKAGNYLVWQLFRRPNHDWLFYPTVVPVAIGPLIVLAALAGLWLLRRETSWREKLLVGWIVVPAVFFELWPVKGFQYLLPIAPAFAILAARAIARLRTGIPTLRRVSWLRTSWPGSIVGVAVALSLLIPSWQQIQPSTLATFLAGSGGIPGGREAGAWVRANTPLGAQFLTLGPSMANIIGFYGRRKAYGLSISSNPLHRNPSYDPLRNPDFEFRTGGVTYAVWDSFSANRSAFFSDGLNRLVKRYNGRVVHMETVPVKTADGKVTEKPVIIIYEVHP